MIRKNLFSLLFILISIAAVSQNTEREINERVWKPFTKAIMTQDIEGFIQLHSKEVMRVERDTKKILNYDQYKTDMEKSWPGWKESLAKNKSKYTFELRFLERCSNGNQAFEVGYFKNESTTASGEKRAYYGQFHVALRKENGIWKILVDSDSNNDNSITETMFQAANPME